MSTFEDLLQKAKEKSIHNIVNKQWKQCISNIMENLHELNSMYDSKDDLHNSNVEQIKCDKCSKASYLIVVKDIARTKKFIKFYRSGWKSTTKGVYVCEQCK